MKRILIHLGLPKTATTTLQHNVLRQLHADGVINFLGKDLDVNPKTGAVVVRNWDGKCIRDTAEEKIPFDAASSELVSLLSSDKLNVFSDEGIMVAYPALENIALERKLANLRLILADFELSFIITLRNPMDYMYSLYVELYTDHYSQVRTLNTFEKYAVKFLKDKDDILFESFSYSNVLAVSKGTGDLTNVTITYFEDLRDNQDRIYGAWARSLGIDKAKFKWLFEQQHRNKKSQTEKGYTKTFSLLVFENYLRWTVRKLPFELELVKQRYVTSWFRRLLNFRFNFGGVHPFPSGSQLESLNQALETERYERDRRSA